MRKPICRLDEAISRLELFLGKLKAEGAVFLPTERELCETLGTSRMTVRKALDALEGRGGLESGPKGRVITANVTPESKGTLLFIAGGVDWIVLPAWNRLWTHMESMARSLGYDCKLKLIAMESEFAPEDWETADFIVYSDVSKDFSLKFAAFAAGRSNIIGVQEEHAEFLKHVVCLDNRAAGRVAAKLLLDAGYRRPALLRQENGYLGFVRREEGFVEELAAGLPGYTVPCVAILCESTTSYVRGYLDKIEGLCAADIDSLFVATDELINLAYDPFARSRRIPDEFGLVTLAGGHEALVHQPPVTAVGHASASVAIAILELIGRLGAGTQPDKPSLTLIEPGVHAGATLRKPIPSCDHSGGGMGVPPMIPKTTGGTPVPLPERRAP